MKFVIGIGFGMKKEFFPEISFDVPENSVIYLSGAFLCFLIQFSRVLQLLYKFETQQSVLHAFVAKLAETFPWIFQVLKGKVSVHIFPDNRLNIFQTERWNHLESGSRKLEVVIRTPSSPFLKNCDASLLYFSYVLLCGIWVPLGAPGRYSYWYFVQNCNLLFYYTCENDGDGGQKCSAYKTLMKLVPNNCIF